MKTIIAEKPSVAKEIAHIVGATKREEGYLQGNGYYVTWAFGHLVQPAMPEAYGMKGFHAENLPVIPNPFILVPRQIKAENGYKPDTGVLAQIKIIGKLFDSSDRIIVATDAGREGELIFRYLYEYLGCKKPFDRLWISSLTDAAIREGLDNLKDGKEYDTLYHAAKARSEADWLVGINGTQALTIAAGRGTYSVGRVQTPTLGMVCERYWENKRFESKLVLAGTLRCRKERKYEEIQEIICNFATETWFINGCLFLDAFIYYGLSGGTRRNTECLFHKPIFQLFLLQGVSLFAKVFHFLYAN